MSDQNHARYIVGRVVQTIPAGTPRNKLSEKIHLLDSLRNRLSGHLQLLESTN